MARHHYGKTLTVHRKGYSRKSYTNKLGVRVKKTRVPAETFRIKERGNPGKGPRLIHINKKDDMNKIAREMGYESATYVPDMHMDSFMRRLVNKYGEQSVRGKITAMINLRKHTVGRAKTKFELMLASLDKQYAGDGWTAASGS